MIGLNNQAKVEGIKKSSEDEAKVKFIAVIDDVTTKMCESLDGQEFYINKENEFERYYGNTQKDLELRKFKVQGLVLGLNLPPISSHFHYCRSTITYQVPVENKAETEYNISNYLRTKIVKNYKNSLSDFKIMQKEYDMLPQNVKNRLEKEGVTILLNPSTNNSGYNAQTKEILLMPELEEGEFIHEIGHALENIENLTNNNQYKEISQNIIENNSIETKYDRTIQYKGLRNTDNCISDYQTFLGYDKITAEKNLKKGYLRELISEGYRAYYFETNNLKKKNINLYNFIKEIENNA